MRVSSSALTGCVKNYGRNAEHKKRVCNVLFAKQNNEVNLMFTTPRKIKLELERLFAQWEAEYPDEKEKSFIDWRDYLELHASPQLKRHMQEIKEIYKEAKRQGVYI